MYKTMNNEINLLKADLNFQRSLRKYITLTIIRIIYHCFRLYQCDFLNAIHNNYVALKSFLYYVPYNWQCKALLYFLWSAWLYSVATPYQGMKLSVQVIDTSLH